MTLTLHKSSDFAVGTDVIDFAWSVTGERGRITDGPKHFDPRWEVQWEDGITTLETFEDMIRYEHVPAAPKGVSLDKPLGHTFHSTYKTPQVDAYLRQWEGPLSTQTTEDLYRNDLRGLDTLLYLMRWDPTPGL